MTDRELIERLAAEIEKATAAGDRARARKLAELQARVVAQISRGIVTGGSAGPVPVPQPRPVPLRERAP